jgi:protein O-mannosyl-transferase
MAIQSRTANNSKRHAKEHRGRLQRRFGSRGITLGIYLFLAGISLVVFAQSIRYNFVNFDDDLYVYNSPGIQAGLTIKGIAAAFTSPHARNWHPLTTLSHMLDCQLYGLKAGGHHATNVILHTLAVLLLFAVLRQMTGAVWKSAFVAALFAVHPLHVESVAWVSERKDVLSAVFFFLMLGAYSRYAHAPSITRYLAVAVLLAAGLMCKPMLVSAPIVLLLLDYWPLGRFSGEHTRPRVSRLAPSPIARNVSKPGGPPRAGWVRGEGAANSTRGACAPQTTCALIAEKIPLFILSAVACVITFVLQKRATGAIPPLPLLWRVQNAFVSYVIYAWKTLWPTDLAVFYPHANDTLAIWEVISSIVLLLVVTAAAIVFRRKRPYLLTGWFWYLAMLVPVIGIIQVGEQGHADRYTYLPHVGLFLLAVWLVADVIAVRQWSSRLAVAGAGVIIVALAWTAFRQTSYWRNSETLWTHALAVTSDNDVAHNNLGYLCVDRDELDNAISHFEAALRIRSGKRDPHYDVGSAFMQMNLANVLARKGQSDEAMVHYNEAIRLQPYYADAYYNRGSVLFAKGHIDEAIADWEYTLQMQPGDANAHTGLGNALLQKGSPREAIAHYEQASALAPEDPHCRNNMAWVLATSSDGTIRDGAKAIDLGRVAVALSGGREPRFVRTLAAAYAENGRFPEALAAAQQAAAIARMQGKTGLANRLDGDLMLYHAHLPLRERSLGD